MTATDTMRTIKIGTRGSQLALCQTEQVRSKIEQAFPDLSFEVITIQTKGDQILRGAIGAIGPGIFTREIEDALLEGQVDLAVHSAKDLACELPKGLVIGAVLAREDPQDCLVTRGGGTLKTIKQGAWIGTTSLWRRSQLKRLRSDLRFAQLRGNIETRLRKIRDGECDGIVLAYAGLKRLGLTDVVTEVFEPEVFLPQAGQGAIAVEIRENDATAKSLTEAINHQPTLTAILAERSFLGGLQGGCQLPVGVFADLDHDRLRLRGAVFSIDGDREVSDVLSGAPQEARQLGFVLAERVLKAGGREILDSIRSG